MGLINSIWQAIVGAPEIDRFYARLPDSRPEDGKAIVADQCYVELYVDSLRLQKARRFATTFAGVVYTFTTLPRQADDNAQLAAISKPANLANLDSNSVGRVIPVDLQMMGATAWRGGPLKLEIGLFSAKTGNLLSPVIDFVSRVSSTAGISFVGAVKPFLPLITEGMDLIAGQKDDINLEVGLDTSLDLQTSGTYAIIDAPKGSIDISRLTLDRDGKLLMGGAPLSQAYCVFSIRTRSDKPDYGQIPALKTKFNAVMDAIRSGEAKPAQDALTAFRLETLASPDLTTADAQNLVAKVKEKVDLAFPGGGVAEDAHAAVDLTELAQIGLYE